MPKTLRLILGDQLNALHSWYGQVDDEVTYVMMEVKTETNQVTHHIQKIVGFFASMRAFAADLKAKGHQLVYLNINDPKNQQSFTKNLDVLLKSQQFESFAYQEPDHFELDEELAKWTKQQAKVLKSEMVSAEHFLTNRKELADFFKGKRQMVMEFFYRYMRKKHQILMDGDEPLNGKWNFDEDNRNKIPEKHVAPEPLLFGHDVSDLVAALTEMKIKTMGQIADKDFTWPITRKESLKLLTYFCEHCLIHFGTYQDAMTPQQWSLYHSRISFSLNTKLLHPLEVIKQVIDTWQSRKQDIAYHQVEGFVRQILGWREYMRGMYWQEMPDFKTSNYFGHQAKLPDWYWTGKTKMQCLQHSITQSLHYAYAHHIQRLMVTGNFALLAGVNPDEVDAWYLGIYIDALEWVEITNTRGMSQYADGGKIATKPYISGAGYIQKMSNYCKNCFYNPKEKLGEKACPFNALYWDFFERHSDKLAKNFRMAMMYKVWQKMPADQKKAILEKAAELKKNVNQL